MLYFILPNFIQNMFINNYFYKLNKEKINYFKDESIYITFHYGSIPYNTWNGGLNSNFGDGLRYNDFISLSRQSDLPLCFNFSNLLLTETDFYDTMSNTILSVNNNGSNFIEISNLQLLKYIKEKYPYYKFIFSKNAHFLYSFSPELLNSIIENQQFNFISIPTIFNNDFDFLSKIKDKSQLILNINNTCPISCKNYNKCIIAENNEQLLFTTNTIRICDKKYDYVNNNNIINIQELKEKYFSLGINHFYIDEGFYDNEDYLQFLIEYFIKPEYQYEILKQLKIGEKFYG